MDVSDDEDDRDLVGQFPVRIELLLSSLKKCYIEGLFVISWLNIKIILVVGGWHNFILCPRLLQGCQKLLMTFLKGLTCHGVAGIFTDFHNMVYEH